VRVVPTGFLLSLLVFFLLSLLVFPPERDARKISQQGKLRKHSQAFCLAALLQAGNEQEWLLIVIPITAYRLFSVAFRER
jgi:hypothetical protein